MSEEMGYVITLMVIKTVIFNCIIFMIGFILVLKCEGRFRNVLEQQHTLLSRFEYELILATAGQHDNRPDDAGNWGGVMADLLNYKGGASVFLHTVFIMYTMYECKLNLSLADIGLGPFHIDSDKQNVVDFTIPWHHAVGWSIMMKKEIPHRSLFPFIWVFSKWVIFLIVNAYIITFVLMWSINVASPNSYRNNMVEMCEDWDNRYTVLCTVHCTVLYTVQVLRLPGDKSLRADDVHRSGWWPVTEGSRLQGHRHVMVGLLLRLRGHLRGQPRCQHDHREDDPAERELVVHPEAPEDGLGRSQRLRALAPLQEDDGCRDVAIQVGQVLY